MYEYAIIKGAVECNSNIYKRVQKGYKRLLLSSLLRIEEISQK